MERSELIASAGLSGAKVVAVEVVDLKLPSFDVVNSDGTRLHFDMGGSADYPDLNALLSRLGVSMLADTNELVGLAYDGDGLTDAQREAAVIEARDETKRTSVGLHFMWSAGGSMGNHQALMLDGKYVGHLYLDASEGVDTDQVLADIVARYNVAEVK